MPGSVGETKKFLRIKFPEWYFQNAHLKHYPRALMAVMLLLLSVSAGCSKYYECVSLQRCLCQTGWWMRNNSDRLWISPLLEGRKTIGITSQKHLFNPLEPEFSSQRTLHKNQDLNGCIRVCEFVVDIISGCLVLQHHVLCWLESTFDAKGLN